MDNLIAGLLGAFIAAMFTWLWIDHDWKEDCRKLGQHRTGALVFVCKEQTP